MSNLCSACSLTLQTKAHSQSRCWVCRWAQSCLAPSSIHGLHAQVQRYVDWKIPTKKVAVPSLSLCLNIWDVSDRPSHSRQAYEYKTKTESAQADRLWEETATETCAAWFEASVFQMQRHCLLFNPACVEAFGEFKHRVFCSSMPSLPCIFWAVFIEGFLLFEFSEFSPSSFSSLRFVIKAERMSDTVWLVD